jgi:hypothetical protein
MVCLAQTVDISCTDTNTTSKQTENEILHNPRHLVVPSGVSKMISEPTIHQSWIKINTISKWAETSIHFSLVT